VLKGSSRERASRGVGFEERGKKAAEAQCPELLCHVCERGRGERMRRQIKGIVINEVCNKLYTRKKT